MNRLGVRPSSSRTLYWPPSSDFDEHVGRDGRARHVAELGAGLGVQLAQLVQRLLDQLHRVAGPPLR